MYAYWLKIYNRKKRSYPNGYPKVELNGKDLQYVGDYKYLGIILDKNVNYQMHVNESLKVAAHEINILSKLSPFLTQKASLVIYKTKVLPYLDYVDIFYMGTNQKATNKLQRLQNRALQICINAEASEASEASEVYPTNRLHYQPRVPLLEHRRIAHLRNFMYLCKDDMNYIDKNPTATRARVRM